MRKYQIILKESCLGWWVEGQTFQSESDVLAIYDQQVQQTSLELGREPTYNGPGPWRGHEGSPPSRAFHSQFDKAIRFAVWHPETDREAALYLTATDADTWWELTRVTLEKPPGPAPGFLKWLLRRNVFRSLRT
jgi:hypothetical protein